MSVDVLACLSEVKDAVSRKPLLLVALRREGWCEGTLLMLSCEEA